MINKIQKVGLATFKTHLIVNQNPVQHLTNPEEQIKSIHSYFVMLRHIFQKNKQVIRRRNQTATPSKNEPTPSQTSQKKSEKANIRKTVTCFGILNSGKADNCNLVKPRENRHYRPYRAKHRSLTSTANALSTSTPTIQPEKDEPFQPIGHIYQQAQDRRAHHSLSKSRAEFATCINFYPRYQNKEHPRSGNAVEFNRNQLRKERRTLLVTTRPRSTKNNQSEELRGSHQSHKSMATEASDVPSPW